MKKSVLKEICFKVANIISECGTRNPRKICSALGINVYYHDLQKELKGYYVNKFGIENIILDSNLTEEYEPIILGHELGHSVLHGDTVMTYHEIGIHDSLDTLEVQAHYFCAELLISDEQVLSAFEEYNDFEAVAKSLYVPNDLLDFKLELMESKGLLTTKNLNYANRNFLKNSIQAYK